MLVVVASRVAATTGISCGNHAAKSCADCGVDWTWCNGECEWNSKQHKCAPANEDTVSAEDGAALDRMERARTAATSMRHIAASLRAELDWWKDDGGGSTTNEKCDGYGGKEECTQDDTLASIAPTSPYAAAANEAAGAEGEREAEGGLPLARHTESSADVLYPGRREPGIASASASNGQYTLRTLIRRINAPVHLYTDGYCSCLFCMADADIDTSHINSSLPKR